jgi:hypothetical protein
MPARTRPGANAICAGCKRHRCKSSCRITEGPKWKMNRRPFRVPTAAAPGKSPLPRTTCRGQYRRWKPTARHAAALEKSGNNKWGISFPALGSRASGLEASALPTLGNGELRFQAPRSCRKEAAALSPKPPLITQFGGHLSRTDSEGGTCRTQ